ncbi:MAG TPA: PLP-dependent aminotransferase family protein [Rhodanobacteraceae bacterium]|nr:PLP-dependent aminotransferase family protein [Rhodanobacteraceae bacterium]
MKREQAAYFPPITLAAGGTVPLYRQLYEWFRAAILDGQLHPGQVVPSTRSLALELCISRAPVLSAYELLHAEGYLETRTGAGTRVAIALPKDLARLSRHKSRKSEMRGSPAPPRVARRARAGRTQWEAPWTRHLGAFQFGSPAHEAFPARIWASLLARNTRGSTAGIGSYVGGGRYLSAMGYVALREVIAEYLGTTRSMRCDPEQIMICQGTRHGLHIAASALLEEGDAVWMEDPGFWCASDVFSSAGARLVAVPVDASGLNVSEGMRRGPDARAVYVTPSHQFPMGYVMSLTRRLQLLDWAARRRAWILEDDYSSEHRFAGPPIASLHGLDVNDRVIYFGTFSKVILPGVHLGYIVIPAALVPAFKFVRQTIDEYSPAVFQTTLTDFIREGHFARHIRRTKALYVKRREALIAALNEYLGDEFPVISTDAGMHLVLLLPPGPKDVELSKDLAEIGISAVPLSTCYLRRPGRNGLLLGYGNVDVGQMRESVARLAGVLRVALARDRALSAI